MAINIRGDTGHLIPFASGAVRVTLHFRRRDIYNNMLLSMNHRYYPYGRHVVPYRQHGKGGDISIYGGTHPYGQGGNGLGGMFRSLFRSATPFLKTTAKKVGKRMLDTGLETGMQLVQDVINGQPLKKATETRA